MLTPQMIDWMRHSALLSQMSVDDHILTPIEREQQAWLAQKKQEILRKMMRGEALDEHETIVADYLLVYAREHVNDTVRSGRIGEARREMIRRLQS